MLAVLYVSEIAAVYSKKCVSDERFLWHAYLHAFGRAEKYIRIHVRTYVRTSVHTNNN